MCGIFAYLNSDLPKSRRELLKILLTGIRSVEYRGCDSAGIAVDDDGLKEGVAALYRQVGSVAALENHLQQEVSQTLSLDRQFTNHCGLAHTRWATHGAPTRVNAHPQTSSPENEFVVVHNGIITNRVALRQFLISKGCSFASETDTEVIPKLCQYLYDDSKGMISFPDLIEEVAWQLDGPFGIVCKSSHFPNELVAAKSGSPLIVGTKQGAAGGCESFLASDAAALAQFSGSCTHLEDGDIVHIKAGNIHIYGAGDPEGTTTPTRHVASPLGTSALLMKASVELGTPRHSSMRLKRNRNLLAEARREDTPLDQELDRLMKGHHEHFAAKEISDQPESLRNTMRGRINFTDNTVKLGGIDMHKRAISRARRICIFAVGSAYNAALAVRNTLEELVDVPISIDLASDYPERRPPICRDVVCLFANYSGEDPSVLAMLDYCRKKGALCIGVTNKVGSTLATNTECGIYLHAGHEVGRGSTKAYTCQIIALLMFALVCSEDNLAAAPRREAIVDALRQLPNNVRKTLDTSATMKTLAAEFKQRSNFLCMARGNQTATCLEGAYKLKQVAMVHSEGIHLGELKHGPLALVDEEMPVLLICTKEDRGGNESDELYPKVKSSLQQVLARSGRPIVIANTSADDDDETFSQVHSLITVPKTLDCLQTVVNIVPLQLLAYHLAVERGIDPDMVTDADDALSCAA